MNNIDHITCNKNGINLLACGLVQTAQEVHTHFLHITLMVRPYTMRISTTGIIQIIERVITGIHTQKRHRVKKICLKWYHLLCHALQQCSRLMMMFSEILEIQERMVTLPVLWFAKACAVYKILCCKKMNRILSFSIV